MARFTNCYRKLIPYHRRASIAASSGQPKLGIREHFSTNNAVQKSTFESNIIRILRNEITYQSELAPPRQPAVEFNSFTVEDRPGERWITMKGKFGEKETIKIEATMFNGFAMVAKNMYLHLSLLVDISKGEGRDLEFVCSAWPDYIEIQKVYVFSRDKSPSQPYMGPNFRDLDTKLRNALAEFLKERGINDDLSVFLHEFMTNKNKVELINWLRSVKSFAKK